MSTLEKFIRHDGHASIERARNYLSSERSHLGSILREYETRGGLDDEDRAAIEHVRTRLHSLTLAIARLV